jgi:hypothetical protein
LWIFALVQDVEGDYRKEMLAARRKLQEQYDTHIKQAAAAKEQVSLMHCLTEIIVYVFVYYHFCVLVVAHYC